MTRVVFEVEADLPDGITDEALDAILGTVVVQVEEPLLGYTANGDEITCASTIVRSAARPAGEEVAGGGPVGVTRRIPLGIEYPNRNDELHVEFPVRLRISREDVRAHFADLYVKAIARRERPPVPSSLSAREVRENLADEWTSRGGSMPGDEVTYRQMRGEDEVADRAYSYADRVLAQVWPEQQKPS